MMFAQDRRRVVGRVDGKMGLVRVRRGVGIVTSCGRRATVDFVRDGIDEVH